MFVGLAWLKYSHKVDKCGVILRSACLIFPKKFTMILKQKTIYACLL